MKKVSSVVLGGGASGIFAAISAARRGRDVVLCEKTNRIGKKILVSGNGRCNLLNENIDKSFYNPSARPLVKSIFDKFGKSDIVNFFRGIGLQTCTLEEGRIFPVTDQASSVLKVLERELSRSGVVVELEFDITRLTRSSGGFLVTSKSNSEILCESIALAGGGMSYPAFGSDGSAYKLAAGFGHSIVKPVPAAVPLVVDDRLCHILQGQRIRAKVKLLVNDMASCESSGDLLFTKYGLSGTAILDISHDASIAINRSAIKDVVVSVDMVPFMDKEDLSLELKRRISEGFSAEDLIVGILPNKFALALKDMLLQDASKIAFRLKNFIFKVTGTRGWNEADFTSGGIDVKEIALTTLESKLCKRLYLAGEILDVCGIRGGYNLAWAWASGFVAGLGI